MKADRILMRAAAGLILLVGLAAATSLLAGAARAADPKPLELPALISSAGQSADVKLAEMIAKRSNLEVTVASMATKADLEGIKTLILVPGFSSKGLGAAGVSQAQELDRVNALIAAAKELNIPVVMMHIGGTARRGEQSDPFNKAAAEASVQMIVVAQGDEDKFFSTIAAEKSIPIVTVQKIAETGEPLAALFASKPEASH